MPQPNSGASSTIPAALPLSAIPRGPLTNFLEEQPLSFQSLTLPARWPRPVTVLYLQLEAYAHASQPRSFHRRRISRRPLQSSVWTNIPNGHHFRRQPSRSKPLAGCQTNRFLPPRGRPAARLKSALAIRRHTPADPPGGRPAARPSCPPALARPTRLSCRPAPGPDLAVLPDRAGSAPAFLPTRPRLPTRPPGPPAPGASEPGPLAIARPPPPMPPPIFGLAVRLGPPVY